MNQLFSEWKRLPRTIKDKNDELWKHFNAMRAESLMYATDFKSTKDEMKSLMEQWKMKNLGFLSLAQ